MTLRPLSFLASFALLLASGAGSYAQTTATAPNGSEKPAKELFGAAPAPAQLPARAIGGYARGCLAGGLALPIDGPSWQVMRLSRNRNYGHPKLIAFLDRLTAKVPKVSGWPGLLIGDLAQPRGGPMLTGHASHQIGLDADIWLTPMPHRTLALEEREKMSAVTMVAASGKDVDRSVWTDAHGAVIKAAAQDPDVERIFVNAAIKQELCRKAGGDRSWLGKVRPWYKHDAHFHVRLHCPSDNPECRGQKPPEGDEGCSAAELAHWFKDAILRPKPAPPPVGPAKPRKQVMLADLPAQCSQVLAAP